MPRSQYATPKKRVPNGKKSSQKLLAKRAQMAERAAKVYELKLAGATLEQIGKQLGVSVFTVHQDFHTVLNERYARLAAMADKVIAMEDDRLEHARRQMVPLVQGMVPARKVPRRVKGKFVMVPIENDPVDVARVQTSAASRLVQISESRRRLHGLDAPTKIAPTDPSGTRPYLSMTLEELEALVRGKEQALGVPPLPIPMTAGKDGVFRPNGAPKTNGAVDHGDEDDGK